MNVQAGWVVKLLNVAVGLPITKIWAWNPVETILLVDDDLGFVFWLGRVLDDAGYAAFPAKSAADASALITQFRLMVDLLIINSAMAGASAFIKELRQSRPNLGVLGIADQAGSSGNLGHPAATLPKPEPYDSEARLELLATVERLLLRSKQTKPFSNMA
jgi:DNA-binding NtrC family response regulator